MNPTTVTLGQTVTYVDSKGRSKAAIVVATSDSLEDGTQIPPLSADQAHLLVFGVARGLYYRYQVPSQALVAQAKAQGSTDFDGRGYFVTA